MCLILWQNKSNKFLKYVSSKHTREAESDHSIDFEHSLNFIIYKNIGFIEIYIT